MTAKDGGLFLCTIVEWRPNAAGEAEQQAGHWHYAARFCGASDTGGRFDFVRGGSVEEIQQNGAPDFNTLSIEQIEERPYVSGNVEVVLECFAESYTTNYGVRTSDESEELYYLVAAAPPMRTAITIFNI